MVATTEKRPFRVILDAPTVADLIIEAEAKYLMNPEAGPNEAVLEKSGVQRFRPMDLLPNLGRDIRSTHRGKPRVFYIPQSQSVLRAMFDEITSTRTKRDEVFAGISNGASAQELTIRLNIIQRAVKTVRFFAA